METFKPFKTFKQFQSFETHSLAAYRYRGVFAESFALLTSHHLKTRLLNADDSDTGFIA